MQARSFHVATGVCVLVLLSGRASGNLITTLSQTHHAWGYVQEVSYNLLDTVPVSGSCEKTIGTDFVQITSDTLGSDEDELHVNAHTTSHEDYIYCHRADAEVSYVFLPNTTPVTIDFTGLSGFHSFESGLTYSLQDLTGCILLDTKSWEYETGEGWVDDVLPYQGIYDLDTSHAYRITIGAHAQLGDQREGFGYLAAVFAPEPGSGMLLALAAPALIGCLRRRT